MSIGLGVMINALAGWQGQDKLAAAIGKLIKNATFADDRVSLFFEDGSGIRLFDNGQSCCESRYMQTDDNVADLVGETFRGIEIREAPEIKDENGEEHEVEFLAIKTDKGEVVFASHNEHNGYYGGFSITCRTIGPDGEDES